MEEQQEQKKQRSPYAQKGARVYIVQVYPLPLESVPKRLHYNRVVSNLKKAVELIKEDLRTYDWVEEERVEAIRYRPIYDQVRFLGAYADFLPKAGEPDEGPFHSITELFDARRQGLFFLIQESRVE